VAVKLNLLAAIDELADRDSMRPARGIEGHVRKGIPTLASGLRCHSSLGRFAQ
jgi:hypothetical protein